jgi:hypothetical protein
VAKKKVGATTKNWVSCYPSAARVATPTVMADQANPKGERGLLVVIDTTVIGAAPSTVFTIEGKDPLSGKYFAILVSAAVVAVGTIVLRVYPGLVAAANLVANDVLPLTWRVKAVHGNANSHTYSVSATPLP